MDSPCSAGWPQILEILLPLISRCWDSGHVQCTQLPLNFLNLIFTLVFFILSISWSKWSLIIQVLYYLVWLITIISVLFKFVKHFIIKTLYLIKLPSSLLNILSICFSVPSFSSSNIVTLGFLVICLWFFLFWCPWAELLRSKEFLESYCCLSFSCFYCFCSVDYKSEQRNCHNHRALFH